MKVTWERIESLAAHHPFNVPVTHGEMYRAKVPGGWIVAWYSINLGGAMFYPDPKHEWDGNSLP